MSLDQLLSDANSPARALAGVMAFYVSGEEALESRMFNTAAGLTVTIGVRFLLPTGEVKRYNFLHTPNTAGTLDRQRFPLPEGWILNASVSASSGTPTGTTCVCVLRVVGGLTANAIPLGIVCQGAITASQEISWPLTLTSAGGGTTTNSGLGLIRAITGTDPAAGSEISETVPANKVWSILAMRATLVASATVANRTPLFLADDGTNPFFKIMGGPSTAASGTNAYSWGPVGTVDQSNNAWTIGATPVPLKLGAGMRFGTSTLQFQAGDNWSAPLYLVEEWSV